MNFGLLFDGNIYMKQLQIFKRASAGLVWSVNKYNNPQKVVLPGL
jgi:hypothetical protein